MKAIDELILVYRLKILKIDNRLRVAEIKKDHAELLKKVYHKFNKNLRKLNKLIN
jgi:hypothetical protein